VSTTYHDGRMMPARLVCQSTEGLTLTFEDTFADAVRVRIGELAVTMTRREITALAVLFPEKREIVLPRFVGTGPR
jgi:hypothetical protein